MSLRAQRKAVAARAEATEGQVDAEKVIKDLQEKVRACCCVGPWLRRQAVDAPHLNVRQHPPGAASPRRSEESRVSLRAAVGPTCTFCTAQPIASPCAHSRVGAAACVPGCLQWDKVENKTSVIVYGAGGIVVLWLASTIVGALNNIPLVGAAAWQGALQCSFRAIP